MLMIAMNLLPLIIESERGIQFLGINNNTSAYKKYEGELKICLSSGIYIMFV